MNKLPRAKCPYCGRTKALKKDGTMYPHNRPSADLRKEGSRCGGSGQRAR